MLKVESLSKHFLRNGERHQLFSNFSFTLPRKGRLAILGRNGQGKSTLIKILGGAVQPSSGRVRWEMTSSWPLGFNGAFQGGMSGIDNIKFVARIYQRAPEALLARVDDFAELGDALLLPMKYYSTGMRARLAFGLSLAIEFDCYLIDEIISVGDELFGRRCQAELFERRADRTFIIASHDLSFIRDTCQSAIIIESGRAKLFDDIDLALDIYGAICLEERMLNISRSRSRANLLEHVSR